MERHFGRYGSQVSDAVNAFVWRAGQIIRDTAVIIPTSTRYPAVGSPQYCMITTGRSSREDDTTNTRSVVHDRETSTACTYTQRKIDTRRLLYDFIKPHKEMSNASMHFRIWSSTEQYERVLCGGDHGDQIHNVMSAI